MDKILFYVCFYPKICYNVPEQRCIVCVRVCLILLLASFSFQSTEHISIKAWLARLVTSCVGTKEKVTGSGGRRRKQLPDDRKYKRRC